MKPRVAIVLPYFGSGGAENMVSRLAAHLDLSRVDAEVICLYGQPFAEVFELRLIGNAFVGREADNLNEPALGTSGEMFDQCGLANSPPSAAGYKDAKIASPKACQIL